MRKRNGFERNTSSSKPVVRIRNEPKRVGFIRFSSAARSARIDLERRIDFVDSGDVYGHARDGFDGARWRRVGSFPLYQRVGEVTTNVYQRRRVLAAKSITSCLCARRLPAAQAVSQGSYDRARA